MEEGIAHEIPSEQQQIIALLPLILPTRLEQDYYWYMLGQCLFNLEVIDGLELWKKYSSDKFIDRCDIQWGSYEKTRYGISTIKTWIKKDNPVAFGEWHESTLQDALWNAVTPTAGKTEIADIAKFLYGDEFLCSDIEHQTWYQFTSHHWSKLSGGGPFRQKFSRDVARLFTPIYNAITEHEDANKKGTIMNSMKIKVLNIITGVKEPSYKTALMRECSEIFWSENFENEKDENYFLFGVPNGVLDMSRMAFREGFPEDWITLVGGAKYHEFSWTHPKVKQTMYFFHQVLSDMRRKPTDEDLCGFPKDPLVDFVLRHKASCLVGGNKEKWLVTYIGEKADNSKTTYQKLDRKVFGKYCGKLPLGVLVGKTLDSNAADPAMAGTKGVRLECLDEATKGMVINTSFLKSRTGNDEFWARALYSNGCTIRPQFTLILYVNQAPSHNGSSDPAVERRMVLVPFDSCFKTNAPESEEEQWKQRIFKADPFFEEKVIPTLAESYLWILLEFYKLYIKEGCKKPQSVIDKTEVYKASNDIFKQFIQESIEITEDPLDYVLENDAYILYKQYSRDNLPTVKVVSKQDASEEFVRLLGQPEGMDRRYIGVRVKSTITRFD